MRLIFLYALHACSTSSAFQPNRLIIPRRTQRRSRADTIAAHSIRRRKEPPIAALALSSANNNNAYDLSKPVFDLYSLRTVRGDALTKYNTVNQSEPLRINLSLFIVAFLVSTPILAPEVTGESLSTLQAAINMVVAAATAYLGAYRNCQGRNRQLRRWERELAAMDLGIQRPNPYDTSLSSTERIGSVLQSGKKVIALYNLPTQQQDDSSMVQMQVLRRRWQQAGVIVVSNNVVESGWMARPSNAQEYASFWEQQLETTSGGGGWFGLSASTGRSLGSGSQAPNSWLEVMGQSLPPVESLSSIENYETKTKPRRNNMDPLLLEKQAAFYETLVTTGDTDAMIHSIFSNTTTSDRVSAVIADGGRLDPWSTCLQPDARPVGMEFVDSDAYGDQYTTCIEVTATGETLLAMQTWTVDGKLLLHETIPWSSTAPAAGMLLCDCRGCVSLVRGGGGK